MTRTRLFAAALALATTFTPSAFAAGRAQTIEYSTFLGGKGDEIVFATAVDREGFIYLAGITHSKDFDLEHPIQGRSDLVPGAGQAFVSKLTPDGASLVYSTYLGGAKFTVASSIAVDDAGFAYVTGSTLTKDFPVVRPALQARKAGGAEGFVTKIDPTGSLVASTYLGGSERDEPLAIRVGPDGGIFVVGDTDSADFPTTRPAIGTATAADAEPTNAFVVKLDASLASVDYAVTIGGFRTDAASGIAVDAAGEAVVVGKTLSNDFPTLDAVQTRFADNHSVTGDAFVTRLDANGGLVRSTFLGGEDGDGANAVAIGADGTVYVAGGTASQDFPSVGFPDPAAQGGNDAFVAAIAPDGHTLAFSRRFGGAGYDWATGLELDASGRLRVVGTTSSRSLATPDAVQAELGGNDDAFLATFDRTGALETATFLGGAGVDFGSAVAVGPDGSVVVAGTTTSRDFPVLGAFQPQLSKGQSDGFVTRIAQ